MAVSESDGRHADESSAYQRGIDDLHCAACWKAC